MPDLPFYLLQLLLLPDVLCYICDILTSLFLRLALTHPADSQDVASVPTPTSDSTDYLPTGGALDNAAIPLAQAPLVAPGNSALARTPEQHNSLARSPTNTPLTTNNLDKSQDENLPPVLQHSQATMAPSQQVLLPQVLTQHPLSHSPQSQDQTKGMFHQASHFYLSPVIKIYGDHAIINNYGDHAIININPDDEFMAMLLQETIPGAAFNSFARSPPPRRLPGTHLAILERCVAFIVNCTGNRKIRWVFGAAGVGKSAIIQSVAEHPLASVVIRASIFFLVNGRNDGSKAIVTLAYQLAAQCEPYRQFIRQEIDNDPSLLRKSMSVQFNKLIVEPFIHSLNSIGRVSILIDGLDECNKISTQRELLQLISDFCLAYPSSPIAWMIASRPEPHITSFFEQASVEAAYEKEEISDSSNEARRDVERFLRAELEEIQNEFLSYSQAQWPSENDFWKLADASGGLFAFAQTVTRYIADPNIGDPTAQLKDVLSVIDAHPLFNVSREEHPMALLDALYSRILSKVPTKVMENARKLLLAVVLDWERFCGERRRRFVVLCNWLGMSPDEARAAIQYLGSVLSVSSDDGQAGSERLRLFHKSFIDYLSDFDRSGFSRDIEDDACQLFIQCAYRVLEQAPDGIDVGCADHLNYDVNIPAGEKLILTRVPGIDNNISLTCPVEEGCGNGAKSIKFPMYNMTFVVIMDGLRRRDKAFDDVSLLRLLLVRMKSLCKHTARILSDTVADRSRRQEFMEQGLLQRIPINMLTTEHIVFDPCLQFHCPTTQNSNLSDPRDSSCTHSRHGQYSEQDEGTSILATNSNSDFERTLEYDFCYRQLENQLESWKTQNPDYPVLVLFTSAGIGIVEFQFIDLEDGMSEWTYHFCHKFSKEERERLGSTV